MRLRFRGWGLPRIASDGEGGSTALCAAGAKAPETPETRKDIATQALPNDTPRPLQIWTCAFGAGGSLELPSMLRRGSIAPCVAGGKALGTRETRKGTPLPSDAPRPRQVCTYALGDGGSLGLPPTQRRESPKHAKILPPNRCQMTPNMHLRFMGSKLPRIGRGAEERIYRSSRCRSKSAGNVRNVQRYRHASAVKRGWSKGAGNTRTAQRYHHGWRVVRARGR